jgi:hypothetical protein
MPSRSSRAEKVNKQSKVTISNNNNNNINNNDNKNNNNNKAKFYSNDTQ